MINNVEYRCPKCGSTVTVTVLLSYPPLYKFKCSNPECDYQCVERTSITTVLAPSSSPDNEQGGL